MISWHLRSWSPFPRYLLPQVLENWGGGACDESGVEKSCQVKAASPGSAWGQAGSHHSLSEVSAGDRNRARLQRPLGVCTRLIIQSWFSA